jgi:histidinol-phosphate/aromatic aminotransferase/cobyric acid decarboxylase-like protein
MITSSQVALKTYTDNTIIQCCERHLIDGLEDVLSPMKVAGFTDAEIAAAAAEPAHVTKKRAMLEAKRESLEKGREVFHRVVARID